MIWTLLVPLAVAAPELVSPGEEPRALLQMTPTAGTRATIEIRTTSHAIVEVGGPLPSLPPTTTTRTMQLALAIGEVGPEAFQLTVEVQQIAVQVQPPPPRSPPLDPATLRGVRGVLRLSRSGTLLASDWTLPAGLDERQKRMAHAVLGSVAQLLAPLPAEPVGPGALWSVAHTVDAGALKVPLAIRWELVSADSVAAALRSKAQARLGETELPSEDGPIQGKITALQADGSATVALPFDGLMGSRSSQLTLHAEVSGWKGMIPVQFVADVTQEQVLTRRP
jgi:hypothetical protein